MRALDHLARWALGHPRLRARLRDVYARTAAEAAENVPPNPDIAEITPIECAVSEITTPRLNLLVPAVSERHVFGGIATAVALFERMAEGFEDVRIVVTDETSAVTARQLFCASWPIEPIGGPDLPGRRIVVAGDRYGRRLPVRASDRFMATAWWTAYAAHRLLDWQREQFALPPRRFVYMIQDFEPAFYAWSSRYALAESTYRPGGRIVAVVNTPALADHLAAQGFRFANTHIFEPTLNRSLAASLAAEPVMHKKRRILVYGRPGVERNAFEILMLGLREWAGRCPGAAAWEVLSAGESHGDFPLPNGSVVRGIGKQSLDGYVDLLRTSAIGVSLMVSPHPSYPPLEMAAFGVRTITNAHAAKDLSRVHPRITSLSPLTQETLSLALCRMTTAFDDGTLPFEVDTRAESFSFPYLSDEAPFPFAPQVVRELLTEG
ncbi:MAG: hypothetical protein EHM87_19540 [Burkholderiales bacterium]|nr:MAG: hypothetical protein EHM87_19540 [Burkholderiales bacterium]